jgi:endoribonuclease Dicer
MENLEILGDCFLKLTVSMSLYHRHPLAGAGALTVEKAKQISNGNLYRIAVQKKLKSYLNVMKINFRGEDANWIPPGYILNETEQIKQTDELGLKRYKNQKVKRKAFADMMEAFIGAFLISTNYFITIQFMKWLVLDVIPPDKKIPTILCSCIDEREIDRIVKNFYKEQAFAEIEKTINYQFNNKAYLIAAFTHPSSFANRLTNCYERLEFLGDAVLDFLVTRHIFVQNKDITPGKNLKEIFQKNLMNLFRSSHRYSTRFIE